MRVAGQLWLICFVANLAACGGGSSNPSNPPPQFQQELLITTRDVSASPTNKFFVVDVSRLGDDGRAVRVFSTPQEGGIAKDVAVSSGLAFVSATIDLAHPLGPLNRTLTFRFDQAAATLTKTGETLLIVSCSSGFCGPLSLQPTSVGGFLLAGVDATGNPTDGCLFAYQVNQTSGTLSLNTPAIPPPGLATACDWLQSPKPNHLYARVGANPWHIGHFSFDAAMGTIHELDLNAYSDADEFIFRTTPSGKFLVVAKLGSVGLITIDANGTLSSLPSNVALSDPDAPTGIAISSAGFIYVSTPNAIHVFRLDEIAHSLTPVTGSPVTASVTVQQVDVSGRFLLTRPSIYRIDATTGLPVIVDDFGIDRVAHP